MISREYIRRFDVLKAIEDYTSKVSENHLDVLQGLEKVLMNIPQVKVADMVQALERENAGLKSTNQNLEHKVYIQQDKYASKNMFDDKALWHHHRRAK